MALRPDDMRYRLIAATTRLGRGTLADIHRAIGDARKALDWSPKDPLAADQLATAMSRLAAVTGDAGDVAAALRIWTDMVERDPNRGRWQLALVAPREHAVEVLGELRLDERDVQLRGGPLRDRDRPRTAATSAAPGPPSAPRCR